MTINADPLPSLSAAASWRLLAVLLERPRPGWCEEVETLACEVDDAELRASARDARGATEGEYLRLFGPGGAVSPREVAHRTWHDPGWVLADLARYYEAFAYRPRAEDPPDHVCVETGFVGYLHLKEAVALAAGDGDAAQSAAEARERFLEEHLAPLSLRLNERLEAVGASHLTPALRLLAERVPAVELLDGPPAILEALEACGACGAIAPDRGERETLEPRCPGGKLSRS
jgi:nitrate reductase assembly molybdenum cofactor insertion protein NarJ